jgi:hypothetical protein
MTALQSIIKEAKSLKKQYPKRYSKWTDYVKQASAIYASKHKGKSPVGKKKATKKKVGAAKPLSKHKDTKSHNVNIRVVSGIKKKKSVKKVVKKSPILTKVKQILKQGNKRLVHGYNLTSGNVRIGACSQMSLKHYQDICSKINEVEKNIIYLFEGLKNKNVSVNKIKDFKDALKEDKLYLRELKTQKTEIKKLL